MDPSTARPWTSSGTASGRLLLSHASAPLTPRELAIGAVAEFGEADVLIRSENDAETIERALRYLGDYFPKVPRHELEVLAHCPVASYEAGSELVAAGGVREEVLFLLAGIVEATGPRGRAAAPPVGRRADR